jgi:type I restriction enzyme, S subunit
MKRWQHKMALGRKPIEIVNDCKHQLLTKAEHWDRIYLKAVAKVQNGFAFSSSSFVKTGGMPLIRIRDIDRPTTVDRFSGIYSDDFIVRKGDVLIGMDGDFKAAIWKGENALLNQRVCRIIPNNKAFDPKFLFLCLQPYLNAINEETSSVTVKHLSSRTIEEIPLPFPSLPEQQAIVAKTEELLSDLENGKQQLQTAQQQLKVYRQSLLKWAFEGKLTNKNVKEGELPKGWQLVTVDEIGKVKGGKRLPKGEAYSEEPTKFPYLRVTDFENQTINLNKLKFLTASTQTQIKNYIISKEDVFISIVGTIGATGTIPENLDGANLTENAAKITDLKNVYNKYLSQFLASMKGQSQIKEHTKTTTQPKLSLFRIEKIKLPLPSLKEQQLIVDELESKLTVCDKIEETISQSLQQAETLRQSILKKAFEGKLVQTEVFTSKKKELA